MKHDAPTPRGPEPEPTTRSSVRLEITITKRRAHDRGGLRTFYVAEIGDWTATGKTAREARDELTAIVRHVASAGQSYRLKASSGVWVLHAHPGGWEYCTPSGCYVQLSRVSRDDAIEAMREHAAQYTPAAAGH